MKHCYSSFLIGFLHLRRISLFFALFITSHSLIGQYTPSEKGFEDFIDYISFDLPADDADAALIIADSLYRNAIDSDEKIKSLLLTSDILLKQEQNVEAMEYLYRALSLVQDKHDYALKAWIYSAIGLQYYSSGFFDKGSEFLEIAITHIDKIQYRSAQEKYRALAMSNIGQAAMEESNFEKAEEYFLSAIKSFKQIRTGNTRNFLLAHNYQLLASVYYGQEEYQKALHHYRQAERFLNETQRNKTLSRGYIEQGFAKTYLKISSLDSVYLRLNKALEYANTSYHNQFKKDVYQNLAHYYRTVNLVDSFLVYNAQYDSLISYSLRNQKHFINGLASFDSNTPYGSSTKKNLLSKFQTPWTQGIGLLFILVIGLGIGFNLKKRKVRKSSVLPIVEPQPSPPQVNPSNELPIAVPNPLPASLEKDNPPKSAPMLSPEIIADIKKAMYKFEKNNQFLSTEMSYSGLVSELNTNSKYLNLYFKNHLNKDYNTYINDLRIEYMVNKLRNDPAFKTYKLTYLADESGFSSYSTFATNFKRVTGKSPSEFIKS